MNSKFQRAYVKYLIKTPIIFYSFLLTGIALFLSLSFTIKLDVTENVIANVQDNKVIVDGKYTSNSDIIYLYTDKNEKIYKAKIIDVKIENEKTFFTIENGEISGEVIADIIIDSQTLFERIFVKAGKG